MSYITIIVFTAVFVFSFVNVFAQNLRDEQKPTQNKLISVQDDPKNYLGLIYSVKQIEQASLLIKEGKVEEAEKVLLNVKSWLIDASENHYKLFQAFNKSQKTVKSAKLEKAHALDFANARDKCYLLLAKIYLIQKKTKDAIPLLVEIVSSQSDSETGNSAYKLLQEIKFSDKAN